MRLDNVEEYLKQTLGNYFLGNRIIHKTSCVGTQQNGVVKRKNRHLLEVARALILLETFLSYFGEM